MLSESQKELADHQIQGTKQEISEESMASSITHIGHVACPAGTSNSAIFEMRQCQYCELDQIENKGR